MWRRVTLVALIACGLLPLLATSAAIGADLPIRPAPPPVHKAVVEGPWPSRFYIGAASNWTHHTGYVPPDTGYSAEKYTWGAKAFGGYRFNETVQVEIAYHFLGRASFFEGSPYPSEERSQAVSGSVVLMSPALSRWVGPTYMPIHFFGRFGLAYKDIQHFSVFGNFREGILSGVFGAGFEFRLHSRVFVRLEYEFISTAIGGPPQAIPALNSSFDLTFGGTHRVINVMHTPLALTFGVNL